MTDQLEAEVWAYLDRIEDIGGALVGIEQGFQQREIQESAFQMQRRAETKDRIVVGVNQYVTSEEMDAEIMRVDPAVSQRRAEHLAALRASRDAAKVDDVLARIRAAAHTTENMMPLLIEAAELYVTIGEMCGVLREEWGEYQEIVTI